MQKCGVGWHGGEEGVEGKTLAEHDFVRKCVRGWGLGAARRDRHGWACGGERADRDNARARDAWWTRRWLRPAWRQGRWLDGGREGG